MSGAWAERIVQLEQIVRELVSCVPWKDAEHLGLQAYCDWCGCEWKKDGPRPTFADHAEDCAWRKGREAIGARHDTEW